MRELVAGALREAKKPVTFKALSKLLKAKEEPLRLALEAAVESGEAYRWPGRSEPFWHLSPEEKAREAILQTAELEALSKTDLSKKAARISFGIPPKRMESYVTDLVAEKQLRAVPALSGSAKLFVKPDGQQAYFAAARQFLEKKLLKAEFSPPEFFKEVPEAKTDAAALLLEAVNSLEPVKGVPVSTLRLRNHLTGMTKQNFDHAALELRKQQKVILSLHADAHNLSAEEKDTLIEGQDGNHYVAIAIR
jgi:hypothetical protein